MSVRETVSGGCVSRGTMVEGARTRMKMTVRGVREGCRRAY